MGEPEMLALEAMNRALAHSEAEEERWRERAKAAEAERDALRERLREAAEVLLGVVAIADALNARPDDGVGLHTRARAILDKMGPPGETP